MADFLRQFLSAISLSSSFGILQLLCLISEMILIIYLEALESFQYTQFTSKLHKVDEF